MGPRHSFLDPAEIEELAARAGLVDASVPVSPAVRQVRFGYTGSSFVAPDGPSASAWATRAMSSGIGDPDVDARLLRVRSGSVPLYAAPADPQRLDPEAVLDWVLACAGADSGLVATAQGRVLAVRGMASASVHAALTLRSASGGPEPGTASLHTRDGSLRVAWTGRGLLAAVLSSTDVGTTFGLTLAERLTEVGSSEFAPAHASVVTEALAIGATQALLIVAPSDGRLRWQWMREPGSWSAEAAALEVSVWIRMALQVTQAFGGGTNDAHLSVGRGGYRLDAVGLADDLVLIALFDASIGHAPAATAANRLADLAREEMRSRGIRRTGDVSTVRPSGSQPSVAATSASGSHAALRHHISGARLSVPSGDAAVATPARPTGVTSPTATAPAHAVGVTSGDHAVLRRASIPTAQAAAIEAAGTTPAADALRLAPLSAPPEPPPETARIAIPRPGSVPTSDNAEIAVAPPVQLPRVAAAAADDDSYALALRLAIRARLPLERILNPTTSGDQVALERARAQMVSGPGGWL